MCYNENDKYRILQIQRGDSMKNKKENKSLIAGIRRIIILSVLIMLTACICVCTFCIYKNYEYQISHDANLVSSMNLQMRENVDSYLNKLEDTSKILFSQADYMKYDATAAVKDNYQVLKMEEKINDYLTSLSLIDNYSDFGIIYRNNHTVGIVSDGTMNLYGADPFSSIEECIGDNRTIWYAGYKGDRKKLYYFRRVNNNSIFVSSFYMTGFKSIFPDSAQLKNVSVILVDNTRRIVFSTDDKSGEIDSKYSNAFSDNDNCTVVGSDFIASVSSGIGNDWQLITSMDLNPLIHNFKQIAVVCVGICIFLIIMFFFLSFLAISGSSADGKNVNSTVKPDSIDELTGLSNAENAENLIADKIETCITGSTIMLALVSIKNYKLINDNYGISAVNEALIKTSRLLSDIYGENNIVGKTGENEFAIFADFTEYDLFKAHNNLKNNLELLENRLSGCELDNNRGMIKYGIGAAIYPDCGFDYDELYEIAKSALKESIEKDNGKFVLDSGKKSEKTTSGKESR